ncbi:PKD domain-containing protein [bacterium]|nr:PKD domain-containing protein [bacterium]
MFARIIVIVLASLFAVLCLNSCGGQNTGLLTAQLNSNLADSTAEQPVVASGSAGGVPAAEGFALAPAAGAELPALAVNCTAQAQANQLTVEITSAGDQQLNAVLFDLRYDEEQYTPLAAQATDALAPLSESLCLQLMDAPGVVSCGQVALDDAARLVNAGEVLATVLFSCEPVETATRCATNVPVHNGALSPLVWDEDAGHFRWYYVNPGDYNQDGLVGVSDLVPLGRNLGEAGPFEFTTALSAVDGNQDDAITIADLTVIGVRYLNLVEGYNLYASDAVGDIPTGFAEPSTIAAAATFPFSEAQGDPLNDRLWFTYKPTAEEEELLIWVRPYALGAEGTRSNICSTDMDNPPEGPDGLNLPPEARLGLSYTGTSVPLAVTLDATASSDPDGEIIFYEWDYEGDGLFDAFSTGAVAQHTYIQPGSYAPLVRVTDNGGLWDTFQSPEFTVTETEVTSIPPVADLITTITSGEIPLTVGLIATGSTDPDGTIVKYEWDFDGDGEYDLDSGADPTVLHTYELAGEYAATVRVTDDDGESGEAAITIEAMAPPANELPVADLICTPSSGVVPQEIALIATGSIDPDGEIIAYQWDFDGDGNYDLESSSPTVHHVYSQAGQYQPMVLVTDNDRAQDTATDILALTSPGEDNNTPIAMLAIGEDEEFGHAPHTVHFDASGSFDPDGDELLYWWDLNGDGNYEQTTQQPYAAYTYTDSGEHQISVFVHDGTVSSLPASVTFIVNVPPHVELVASSTSAQYKLRVDLDASGSYDVEDDELLFEWDLDGDQVFNQSDAEQAAFGCATVTKLFEGYGVYKVTVRVTDGDEAVSEATVIIRLWLILSSSSSSNSSVTLTWDDYAADEYKIYRSTVPNDTAPFLVGIVAADPEGENSFTESMEFDDGRWIPTCKYLDPPYDSQPFPAVAPMVNYYYRVAPVVDGIEYALSPDEFLRVSTGSVELVIRDWPDTTNQTKVFSSKLRPDLMTEQQREWMANNYVGALEITLDAADSIRTYNPDFITLNEQWATFASPTLQGSLTTGIRQMIYGNTIDESGYWDYISQHENWFVHADSNEVYHNRSTALPYYDLELYWLDIDSPQMYYIGANIMQFLGENHFDGGLLRAVEPAYNQYPPFGSWPNRSDFIDYWQPKISHMLSHVDDQYNGWPKVFVGVWDWFLKEGWPYTEVEVDYNPCDGIYVERFLMGDIDHWSTGSARFPVVMQNVLDAENSGHIIILNSDLDAHASTADERMAVLACYLLLRDEHTYLYFHDPYTAGENDAYPWWTPELAIPTGAPLDPLAVDIDDYLAIDDGGNPYYRRDFADCSAIVKLTGSSVLQFSTATNNLEYVVVTGGGLVDEFGTTPGSWEWQPVYDNGTNFFLDQGGYVVRGLAAD